MTEHRVTCPYCLCAAELVDSSAVYRKSYGLIWLCRPCGAWVGVHKNSRSHAPLGTLANEELRFARRMAHKAFDPLWEQAVGGGLSKSEARTRLYAWLAEELGMPAKECHIGMFSLPVCVRVIEICAARRRKEAAAASVRLDV